MTRDAVARSSEYGTGEVKAQVTISLLERQKRSQAGNRKSGVLRVGLPVQRRQPDFLELGFGRFDALWGTVRAAVHVSWQRRSSA